MKLQEKWYSIINLHLDSKLDNWNFAFKKYRNLYDLMIDKQSEPVTALFYSIFCMSYLSKVYLYNLSEKCEDDLYNFLHLFQFKTPTYL